MKAKKSKRKAKMDVFLPSGLYAGAQSWVSTTSAQICIWMAEPLYGQRGEPELQELPIFFLTTMSIFSIRKKDDGVFTVLTSPTSHFWAADLASYSASPPPPSKRLRSRRFYSSIFRNVCRVGVFSQGCLSSHINAGVFADTERAVVKEERKSGMTLHTAVMEYLVSPHRESCSRAVVQTLTASCKLRITEWNTVRHHFLFLCRAVRSVWYQLH